MEKVEFLPPVTFFFSNEAVPEKSKMSKPIRDQGGHLCFVIGPKTQTWSKSEFFLPVKFRQIPSCGFREVENVWVNIRRQAGNFRFPFGPKNTNLVEDVVFLLSDQFCQIPFSGFRGVKSVKQEAQRATSTVAYLSTMNAVKIWLQKWTKNNKTSSHMLQEHFFAFGLLS